MINNVQVEEGLQSRTGERYREANAKHEKTL